MRSLCAGRHGAEPGKYGACRDVRLPEFPPAGAAYVARARRSGRDPFPGENRREVRHDAPSQTVRGRTLRGEIPFDLAEVLRRPAGMGGQAQPSAYRRPRRNLGGEDRRKHAADPDRGGVADALPRGSRRRHGRIPRRGAAARPGESAAGAGPDAGTDPRTRIFL